ncbi:MAG: formyltransferase family protein, partial [Bacteroidales bacterium]
MNPIRIAIFASGNGSNAQRIAEYFAGFSSVEISAIYCNNKNAFVLERAKALNIPSVLFDKDTFYNSDAILKDLITRGIDWV